jgi:hypothetical protein
MRAATDVPAGPVGDIASIPGLMLTQNAWQTLAVLV